MAQNIRHVVVLMLENRSFDHMLGFTLGPGYPVDGLTGSESNPVSPTNPATVSVSPDAPFEMVTDGGHSLSDTNIQLFLNPAGPPPAGGQPNQGFVFNYGQQKGMAPAGAGEIMRCFNPASLPTLSTLAAEFAVCDRWFSSMPGPTWPNRFFVHSATSKGEISNNWRANYDMRTIFENLTEAGLTWGIFSHDVPQAQLLWRLLAVEFEDNWQSIGGFKRLAREGRLPSYSFIEPKYTGLFGEANDQHPPHDVRPGEKLIASVYEAVRTSPQWNDTLLVVTYDEHGGLYDHVEPPSSGPAATPPDDKTAKFGFNRLGVRVPTVLVSPWIPRGTIVSTTFDHASVPATLKAIFGLPEFLTARDANAATFHGVPSLLAPRTDARILAVESDAGVDEWGDPLLTQSDVERLVVARQISNLPVSDFVESMVQSLRTLPVDDVDRRSAVLDEARPIETEHDAAVYIRQVMSRFRARQRRLRLSGARGVVGPVRLQ